MRINGILRCEVGFSIVSFFLCVESEPSDFLSHPREYERPGEVPVHKYFVLLPQQRLPLPSVVFSTSTQVCPTVLASRGDTGLSEFLVSK